MLRVTVSLGEIQGLVKRWKLTTVDPPQHRKNRYTDGREDLPDGWKTYPEYSRRPSLQNGCVGVRDSSKVLVLHANGSNACLVLADRPKRVRPRKRVAVEQMNIHSCLLEGLLRVQWYTDCAIARAGI